MKPILYKLICSLPVTLFAGTGTQVFGQQQRPNLVYIFPDQYRLNALSIWNDVAYRNVLNTVGDPVHTPNLDRLAKQSVIFNRACSTCPLSSPHRAMLMTGAFPEKNGVPVFPTAWFVSLMYLRELVMKRLMWEKRIGIVRKPCLTRRIIM